MRINPSVSVSVRIPLKLAEEMEPLVREEHEGNVSAYLRELIERDVKAHQSPDPRGRRP